MNSNNSKSKENRKYHVLMVDDNVQDFKLLSVMIRANSDANYEFYWAKDSHEAEDALSKLWIDLVAVDYNLGIELGTDVIKKLTVKHPNVAYVMITGMEDPDLYKAGLEAGASDFIVKSDNNAKIFDQTVQFAVEHKRIENSLKASNESKNRLMSLLANDLENPLTNLVKSLAVVRTQADDLSKKDLTRIIDASYRSSYEAMSAIKTILEWGRDQSGPMQPNLEMVNVTEAISHVFNFLAIEAEKKNIELTYKGDCGLKAYTDVKMLNSVLRNLVANAIRSASSHKGVDVITQVSNGKMNIAVRSLGVELEPSKLLKMQGGEFDNIPGKKSKSRSKNSLEMCWFLLDLLGTDLHIDSSAEEGTVYSFDLPIDLPQVDLDEIAEGTLLDVVNSPSTV